jgi:hypothetical protein
VSQFTFNDAEPGRYLYHYTRPDTLALILDNGRLRLGSYAGTNDPRESKEWLSALTADTFDDLEDGESLELVLQIDRWVRRGVRLSCFTLDYPEPPDWAGGNFHSGWARARMWHQYAGDHTGAVVVFDAERLIQQVEAAAQGDQVVSGPVAYADRALNLVFPLQEVRGDGLVGSVTALRDARVHELFFTKNQDWASEREFRIVVLGEPDEPPLDVEFGDSLVAVVLGEAFPPTELSVLDTRLSRIDRGDIPIGRCLWWSGAPMIVPPR